MLAEDQGAGRKGHAGENGSAQPNKGGRSDWLTTEKLEESQPSPVRPESRWDRNGTYAAVSVLLLPQHLDRVDSTGSAQTPRGGTKHARDFL